MAFKQARRVGERLAKLDSCAANEVTFFAKSEFILQVRV